MRTSQSPKSLTRDVRFACSRSLAPLTTVVEDKPPSHVWPVRLDAKPDWSRAFDEPIEGSRRLVKLGPKLSIVRPAHGEREGLAHLVDFTRPHHTHREASECYGASTPARRSALSPCTLAAQLHAAADSWLGRTATFGAASSWCRQENLSPCMLEGFSVDAVPAVKLVLRFRASSSARRTSARTRLI